MAVKKHYGIKIVRQEEDEDRIMRSTFLKEEKIESVGGIGNYVESIDSLLSGDEIIEIKPEWV